MSKTVPNGEDGRCSNNLLRTLTVALLRIADSCWYKLTLPEALLLITALPL